jgi:DNA-binding protein HU-beta
MNKSDLIDKIAERADVSKADTEKVLKAFEEVVQQVVAKGDEKLTLAGFVSFEQTHRKARTARNPQTGEPIKVPATNAVKITPGATLKKVAKGTQKPPK